MPKGAIFDINSLDALTDWWEGAGVPADRRTVERMLMAAETHIQEASAFTPAARPARPSDALNEAKVLARKAQSLEELKIALEGFTGCDLRLKANSTVFADGNPAADIMVIGEGPGRDEDIQGKPFVGRAGQLLDKMLAAIGLSRETNVYITNVNFWRPPGNRNPTDEELAICRPFVDRHIELVSPRLIIATGAVPAKSLLGSDDGITKLRGRQMTYSGEYMKSPLPVFPIFHPAYLLRRPAEKAKAWNDLLGILAHMEKLGIAPDRHL